MVLKLYECKLNNRFFLHCENISVCISIGTTRHTICLYQKVPVRMSRSIEELSTLLWVAFWFMLYEQSKVKHDLIIWKIGLIWYWWVSPSVVIKTSNSYIFKKIGERVKKKYKNGPESCIKCLMMPNIKDCSSELMKTMKNYLIKLKNNILDNFTT